MAEINAEIGLTQILNSQGGVMETTYEGSSEKEKTEVKAY